MKLSSGALLEIVAIVQAGIMGIKDASAGLRDLDLVPVNEKTGEEIGETEGLTDHERKLTLSPSYIAAHPRANSWAEPPNEEHN